MTVYLSNRDGNGKTNEEGHYRLQTRVLKGSVLNANDLKVVQTSPLSMAVYVSAGDYRMELASGYSYTGWLDVDSTVSITTADPANPRITTIVLYVDKAAATSASPSNNPGIAKLMAVNGSPGSSPIAPTSSAIQTAVGAGNPYMKLADVAVAATATQITNANITDYRTQIGLADSVLQSSNLAAIVGNLMYPVGSIYTNANVATNPATLLGFGTWVQYASGRVLVSQDSSQAEFDTLNETGGAKTNTLVNANIPAHWHSIFLATNHGDGDYVSNQEALSASLQYGGRRRYRSGTGQWPASTSSFSGQNEINGTVDRAATSFSVLPPYVVVYMWRRTA